MANNKIWTVRKHFPPEMAGRYYYTVERIAGPSACDRTHERYSDSDTLPDDVTSAILNARSVRTERFNTLGKIETYYNY